MNEKLEEIQLENKIIIIYYVLLTLYLYANKVETEYLQYGNQEDKDKYKLLLYIVFGVTALITFFYTIQSIKSLEQYDSIEIQKLKELSTLANILILIASLIILYVIYNDKDINLEVSL